MVSSRLRIGLLFRFVVAIMLFSAGGAGLTERFTRDLRAQSSSGCPTFRPPACVPIGAPLPGLTSQETTLFNTGAAFFAFDWGSKSGLGPVFTGRACVGCHDNPNGGGNSNTIENTFFGALNADGSFNPLTSEGGTLLQPLAASAALGFHCSLSGEVIPADATIVTKRQTPPTFGDGLIDSIADATILANVTNEANNPTDQALGIHGAANMTLDYNSVLRPGRFGFKAQRPTLLQFVADALQHDIGVTNQLNPNEDLPQGKPIPAGCNGNDPFVPESGIVQNLMSMFQMELFLAPRQPAPLSSAAQAGQQTFLSIGCSNCHMPSMTTAASVFVPLDLSGNTEGPSVALSNQTANLYSDLLLHDLGPALDDSFPQGQATGSQWRTTPLWGLSLKTVYLHDGRASDLTTAIESHGGEASAVIANFQALSATDQANLLAFLNSL